MSGRHHKAEKPAHDLTTDEALKRLFPAEVADAAKQTALDARKKPKQP